MSSPNTMFRLWVVLVCFLALAGLYKFLDDPHKPHEVSMPAGLFGRVEDSILSAGKRCVKLKSVYKCFYDRGEMAFFVCSSTKDSDDARKDKIYYNTFDKMAPVPVFRKVTENDVKNDRFKTFSGTLDVCPADPFTSTEKR